MRNRFVLIPLILLCVLAAATCAAAKETAEPSPSPSPEPTAAPVSNADIAVEAVVGYDGLVVMNRWAPAFVTVANDGPDFEGVLGVNVFHTQTKYDRYELPLTLASGAAKRVALPIKPMVRQDMYAFELVSEGTIVAEKRVAPARLVAPETVTVGLLSEDPSALMYMDQRANGVDTLRGEAWVTVPLTLETFPETGDLMASFSMLVVDGIDPGTLSGAQREALTGWLLGGGVVYVSGGAKAAQGYPFFEKWTGLAAGKLSQVEDITPGLLSYMTVSGKPVEEPVWLNAMPREGAFLHAGEAGLLSLAKAEKGLIYSAAFDLGGKPLSDWPSMLSFWPRVLRQSAPEDYQALLTRAEQARYTYEYQAVDLINNSLRVENGESALPVWLLLAAFVFLAGFGGYWALKKADKREWLWAAVPAAALLFAGILLLMSNRSTVNDPVALTASRVLLGEAGAKIDTYIGVASPDKGEMTVGTDTGRLPSIVTTDGYYYGEDSTDKLYRPLELNQRYTLGANPTVGFAAAGAWDARMLSLSGEWADAGMLTARLWMEADGVHGEVRNDTNALLTDCMVITTFGFCMPGDLLPGQRAEFAMIRPDAPVDVSAPDFKLKPGVLYTTFDVDVSAPNYYRLDFSSYLTAALYPDGASEAQREKAQRANSLITLFESELNFYDNTGSHYVFAFNDALGRIGVEVNGVPVTRTAHVAAVGMEAAFEPIGPTGEVLFPQGKIRAELIVDMGDKEKPRMPTEADGEGKNNNVYLTKDTYINIGAPVAFRFLLPEYGTYGIEQMALWGRTYESVPTVYLYNNLTGAWDAQKQLTVSMDGEGWAPYVDEDGALYVRYVPQESAGRYEGMEMPQLALRGKVK